MTDTQTQSGERRLSFLDLVYIVARRAVSILLVTALVAGLFFAYSWRKTQNKPAYSPEAIEVELKHMAETDPAIASQFNLLKELKLKLDNAHNNLLKNPLVILNHATAKELKLELGLTTTGQSNALNTHLQADAANLLYGISNVLNDSVVAEEMLASKSIKTENTGIFLSNAAGLVNTSIVEDKLIIILYGDSLEFIDNLKAAVVRTINRKIDDYNLARFPYRFSAELKTNDIKVADLSSFEKINAENRERVTSAKKAYDTLGAELNAVATVQMDKRNQPSSKRTVALGIIIGLFVSILGHSLVLLLRMNYLHDKDFACSTNLLCLSNVRGVLGSAKISPLQKLLDRLFGLNAVSATTVAEQATYLNQVVENLISADNSNTVCHQVALMPLSLSKRSQSSVLPAIMSCFADSPVKAKTISTTNIVGRVQTATVWSETAHITDVIVVCEYGRTNPTHWNIAKEICRAKNINLIGFIGI